MNSRTFGKEKMLILWFHLIISDIQGNNNLAASNKNSCFRPYQMCKCAFDDLDSEELTCDHVTIAELLEHKEIASHLNKTAARDVMKQISRHDINTV